MVIWFRKLSGYDLEQKRAEAEDAAREIGRRFGAAAAVLLCSLCSVRDFFPHANISNLQLNQWLLIIMW